MSEREIFKKLKENRMAVLEESHTKGLEKDPQKAELETKYDPDAKKKKNESEEPDEDSAELEGQSEGKKKRKNECGDPKTKAIKESAEEDSTGISVYFADSEAGREFEEKIQSICEENSLECSVESEELEGGVALTVVFEGELSDTVYEKLDDLFDSYGIEDADEVGLEESSRFKDEIGYTSI